MLKNISNFLTRPLNISETKQGKGTVKRALKNKQGDIYYIVNIDTDNAYNVDAKSVEYAKTSPVLDIGTVVNVKYFVVGKNTFCEIQDNILVTANEDRNKKFIYFACVGIMAVVLFGIFMGAKLIF